MNTTTHELRQLHSDEDIKVGQNIKMFWNKNILDSYRKGQLCAEGKVVSILPSLSGKANGFFFIEKETKKKQMGSCFSADSAIDVFEVIEKSFDDIKKTETVPEPKKQNTRTYCVLQEDSRGVEHKIASGLSMDEAVTMCKEGRERGVERDLIRERPGKTETYRHPARLFTEIAACHICGHDAASHQNVEELCAKCKALYENTESIQCKRTKELVLLDGIADFAAESLSLQEAISDVNYQWQTTVEKEAFDIGFRLTKFTEKDKAIYEAK